MKISLIKRTGHKKCNNYFKRILPTQLLKINLNLNLKNPKSFKNLITNNT